MSYKELAAVAGCALVMSVALATVAAPVVAVEPQVVVAASALDYIETLQNEDGGFPAFDEASSPGGTLDAVFAMVAAGQDVATVTRAGISATDYLMNQAAEYATDPGAAAKLVIGVAAVGLDPTDFGGQDLVAIMDMNLDAETGAYGLDLFDEALYILARAAAGVPVPDTARAHLRSVQADDGGWEFFPDGGSDVNSTAITLQAIMAAGTVSDDEAIRLGLRYLSTAQNPDGGFGFLPGEDSDANSTAFAIQALMATGEDIDEESPWAPGGVTPLDGLLSFQNSSTGAFQFVGSDSPFATYQAVPGLMLAPFPGLKPMSDAHQALATPVAVNETPLPMAPTTATVQGFPTVGAGPGAESAPSWLVGAILVGAGALGATGVVSRRAR